VPSYRANAIPTCECGARLPDAPLLSPADGKAVCAACHGKALREGAELAEPQSRPGEALRHLALSLTTPKGDPMLARRGICRACGGVTHVDSVREHIEEFALLFGRSYGHLCEKCGMKFRTETLWATFARMVGGTMVLGLAWLFWFVSGTANNVVAALLLVLGTTIVGQRVVRIRNRWFARRTKKLAR
jgi:hypothetical protein